MKWFSVHSQFQASIFLQIKACKMGDVDKVEEKQKMHFKRVSVLKMDAVTGDKKQAGKERWTEIEIRKSHIGANLRPYTSLRNPKDKEQTTSLSNDAK